MLVVIKLQVQRKLLIEGLLCLINLQLAKLIFVFLQMGQQDDHPKELPDSSLD